MNNEVGAMICEQPDGSTKFGPMSYGTHDNVSVTYSCPPNSKPVGVWHTHPHGTTKPSSDDIKAAKSFGLKKLCITQPQNNETSCQEI